MFLKMQRLIRCKHYEEWFLQLYTTNIFLSFFVEIFYFLDNLNPILQWHLKIQ